MLGVIFLILLWLFVYLAPHMLIPVKPGEAGVLWKRLGGGTVADRGFGEGMHIIFPWDKMYIYDLRYQQQSKDFEVLSSDGLLYSVEVTVRFRVRPETLPLLHQCVGPHYVETLVFPEVGAVTRLVIAQLTPDELYTSRRQESETAILKALRLEVESCHQKGDIHAKQNDSKVSRVRERGQYLDMNHVFIRRVVLPARVAEAIENKLAQRQQMLEYDYRIDKERKEAERKKIEANGIKAFQEIVQESISQRMLQWKGIEATVELAKSSNSKIVIIGSSGKEGLPLILGPVEASDPSAHVPKNQTNAQRVGPK